MSTTEQAVEDLLNEQDWTGKIFSDGWVDAPETIETIEPATGEVLGVAGVANAASVAAAAKSAARAQREWAALPIAERAAIVSRAGELLERHRAEIAGWMVRESGAIPPKVDHEIGASIGQLERGRDADRGSARAGADVPDTRAHIDRTPRPDRRGRRDHAVELPDRAGDAVDRPGARARKRGGAQERSEHTGERRRRDRTRVRGGRPALGRPPRLLRRPGGRAGAGRGPERPHDLVHRVDEDRARGRRDRRPHAEARRARARRQLPADRARRRGHRGCVVCRRLGLVPAPGPDLPGGEPAPRARVDRR